MTTKIPEDKTRTPNGRKRALLDTNIWRYVIDNDAQGHLLRLARDGLYDVQIAPAVVFETLRLEDLSLRKALMRLMTNPGFHRLMPEAYSESMEILREVERIRPDWLRDRPEIWLFKRLKKDWSRKTVGFWVRCERSPQSQARYIAERQGGWLEAGKSQIQLTRKEMFERGWKRNPPMDKTLITGFDVRVPGWRGDRVEAWRGARLSSVTYALTRQGHPYRDWIAPFIELDDGLLQSAAWGEFWLYLIDKAAAPRQWMRWAHSFAQQFRKITPGSVVDMALSSYFFETDVVVTADKALIDILEECRPYAPRELPDGKLVPAGSRGVADLFRLFET
jgi:hypothetical protein